MDGRDRFLQESSARLQKKVGTFTYNYRMYLEILRLKDEGHSERLFFVLDLSKSPFSHSKTFLHEEKYDTVATKHTEASGIRGESSRIWEHNTII